MLIKNQEEVFGECEKCGKEFPENKLKFVFWKWLCFPCLKKLMRMALK